MGGRSVNHYINNKLVWLWNIVFSYLWVNSGEMPKSNTKDRITWPCQYSPNAERPLTFDKPRGVQSADRAASSLHGRMPESSLALPSVGTGAQPVFSLKASSPVSTKVAAQPNLRHAATFQMPKIINVKIYLKCRSEQSYSKWPETSRSAETSKYFEYFGI